MNKEHKGTPWWVPGDLNGYFGLFSNVLTNFLAAIGLLLVIQMPSDMVFNKIVPSTALIVGLGGIILAYQAKRLSVKTGNENVTAMPYGLSVPHYFAVAFGVIVVVYGSTGDWQLAWGAGLAWNLVQGIIMTIGAFVGPFINKYVPRTAMLGALAGLAVTYIAMNPAGSVYATPYIGLMTFGIILVGWFGLKQMPFKIPAGAFAIILGTIIAWVTGYMDPTAVTESLNNAGLVAPMPAFDILFKGFDFIGPFLASAIPLAIYDFLESLDNLESAAAAGEHYNITQAMLVPGLLTTLGAFIGSPYPTIIYIGHPGWKATGARVGYSWATGASMLVLGFTGMLGVILTIIPLVALLPILMYIAMVIGTQAFSESEKRHFPAIILSFMPLIAGFLVLKINGALKAAGTSVAEVGYEALSNNGIPMLGWERLGAADILVGMLLCSIAIYVIDKKYITAAVYSLISAALSFIGLIHSTTLGFGAGAEVAVGYVILALVFVGFNFYGPKENAVDSNTETGK